MWHWPREIGESERCDHKQALKWDRTGGLQASDQAWTGVTGPRCCGCRRSSLLFSLHATQKEIELNFVPADITLIQAAGNW